MTREELIGRAILAQQEVANQKAQKEEQRYREAATLLWQEAVTAFGDEHLEAFGFSVVRGLSKPFLQARLANGALAELHPMDESWIMRYHIHGMHRGIDFCDDVFDGLAYQDRLALAVHIAENNNEE